MSRIFDALQRSGVEQSGVEYPDIVSVATEVFEAPAKQAQQAPQSSEAAPSMSDLVSRLVAQGSAEETAPATPSEFPSVGISPAPASRLVFLTDPDSLAAEKFRFLGVKLRQMQQNRPLKKLLITSTTAEEGKSLISANLAGVLGRRKQRVLLIEGDLRRPTLANRFGLGRMAGLGEWLKGERRQLSNIYYLENAGYWIMPAGEPLASPLEVMQSGRISELIGQVASRFDWILIDSPPLLPLADTTVWSRVSDGTLLVIRQGVAEKKSLERGLETLKTSELLGVVLNSCTETHHSYYDHYSYEKK